ncbi:crossover junction endodeoxyribonuclease RuvC [Candidatus Falkowbacteria bacterium]|nr:crossover junction endodeoxyribonuclease RuvC [Candidatus Falkowbacteria bacterium]
MLGIDPGIADTGIGIIDAGNGNISCLHYESLRTKSSEPLSTRLVQLHHQLAQVIKAYQPDIAAIEQLFFCNNAKTAIVVGQARGVALLALSQASIPTYEFTPLQVKQAVSTYGKADKAQVQRMVKLLLRLEELPRPDDAADALAIAICAANEKLQKTI